MRKFFHFFFFSFFFFFFFFFFFLFFQRGRSAKIPSHSAERKVSDSSFFANPRFAESAPLPSAVTSAPPSVSSSPEKPTRKKSEKLESMKKLELSTEISSELLEMAKKPMFVENGETAKSAPVINVMMTSPRTEEENFL
jgi:hypothetical protein